MSVCRRRRAGQFWSAPVKRNRRRGVGDQNISSKVPEKCRSILNIFWRSFLVIDRTLQKISTQQKWHRRRADKLSAAARRSTKVGGGGGPNKLSAASWPAQGSTWD